MSAWLVGPVAGPLVEGDLCEALVSSVGPLRQLCGQDAEVIAVDAHTGSHRVLCGWHADRHRLVSTGAAA